MNQLKMVLIGLIMLATASGCNNNETYKGGNVADYADSVITNSANTLYSEPHKADSIYEAAQQIVADEESWHKLELYRGIAHQFMGDSDGMQSHQKKVGNWLSDNPNALNLISEYNNHKGVSCSMSGDFDSACGYFKKAYDAKIQNAHVDKSIISICINLADSYFMSGKIPQSAYYYKRGLTIADSINCTEDIPALHTGLGRIYTELYNFKEAYAHFEKVEKVKSTLSLLDSYIYHLSLGNCYFFDKQLVQALHTFNKAQTLAKEIGNEFYEIQCCTNLGEVLFLMGSLEKAAELTAKSVEYADRNPDSDPSVRFYIYSIDMAVSLESGNTERATKMVNKLFEIEEVQMPRYLALHHKRLNHYYELIGDWKNAYHHLNTAINYEDSLRNHIVANNVNEMRFRYEQDTTMLHQKVMIAELHQKEAKHESIIAIASLTLIIMIMCFLALSTWMKYKTGKNLRKQFDEITSLRMGVIRNRVSPHYIFNVLGIALPKFRQYPELTHPIELLIDVIRDNLMVSDKISESIGNEISLVKNYIKLQHSISGPSPKVIWEISPNLTKEIHVPTMCMQIPVENAFKHAFNSAIPENEIRISINYLQNEDTDDNYVSISVTDNGQGYNPGRIRRTGRDTGTGISALSKAIEMLNKQNSKKITFSIKNLKQPEHGTKVEFVIPEDFNFALQIE